MELKHYGDTVVLTKEDFHDIIFNEKFDYHLFLDTISELRITSRPVFHSIVSYDGMRGFCKQNAIKFWTEFYNKFCETYSFPCVISIRWNDKTGFKDTEILTIAEYLELQKVYRDNAIKSANFYYEQECKLYSKYL